MIRATHHFPRDFLWGTATSSHQVEGGNVNNDWWAWEERPGKIFQGHRSGQACDWWGGRWQEDLDRAAADGHNAHRLSIEWSRIEPSPATWDESALDRYRWILRGLLDRGLMPMVALHHFTTPYWLIEGGGWINPEIATYFERYVRKVVEALHDLVGLWITINEPNVFATLGFVLGVFPPGEKDLGKMFSVVRNVVRAHAAAYRTIHEIDPHALVGLSHHYRGFRPARSGNPLDRWATAIRSKTFNDLLPDAVSDGRIRFPGRRARVPEAAGTQDFFGLNYYTSESIAFDLRRTGELFGRAFFEEDADLSETGWIVNDPNGMWNALRWARRYKLPIYITENGVDDSNDHLRPRYLAGHIQKVWHAVNFNWDVRGYFIWTLVDNFEWERGWSQRFGLYELDPATQERRRRPSAEMYAEICKAKALSSEMVARYAPEVVDQLFPPSNPGDLAVDRL